MERLTAERNLMDMMRALPMSLVVRWELKKAVLTMMVGMISLELDSASQSKSEQMTEMADNWANYELGTSDGCTLSLG